MKLATNATVLELKPGQVLTLDDAQGAQVRTRCGTVWLTEEGNRSDFVLGAGQDRVISRGGRTIIQAISRAWVSIRERALDPVPAPKPIDEFLYDVRFRMQTRQFQ